MTYIIIKGNITFGGDGVSARSMSLACRPIGPEGAKNANIANEPVALASFVPCGDIRVVRSRSCETRCSTMTYDYCMQTDI